MARSSLKGVVVMSSILVASGLFGGCGSTGDNVFDDAQNQTGGASGSGGFGGTNGDDDPAGSSGGSSGGAGEVGNVDPKSACATASEGAVLRPISLVFMIDRSGSMGGKSSSVRWTPVKKGLMSFFGDAKSTNISASIAFFPIGGDDPVCASADYAKAVVGMTQLPNAGAFSSAFDQGPDGRTPTRPALAGAIASAKTVKATGKNVAVVLATDGRPNDCKSTVDAVNKVAADGLKDGVRTYVVGVGPETGNLDSFAQNGGTGKAIMIPTNNAAQVSADLQKAIGQIASSLLGCNYGLPAPPAGQTLDVNAVNVNYTPPGGAAKTLPYSADCSNPNGWRYDNTAAPKEVILCQSSCNTAKSQTGAKVDIVFGCATAVPPGGTDPNGNVH